LILAATPPAEHPFSDAYVHAAHVAAQLAEERHFVLDPQQRFVRLTEQGLAEICSTAQLPKGMALERPWPVYVEQALLACYLLRRDIDYVVNEGRVMLVDHATGRVFADRSLRNGLHQAVEAKERLEITAPRQTLAGIPRQRFLRLYRLLCGMTGTACEAAPEFREIYQRRVVVIPTRTPCRRIVLPTRFFASQVAKRAALVELVRQRHAVGQPVLIGTRTIAESQHLAALLDEARMPYQLLNGVQDMAESSIVARAGQAGAITIATNIAGRGTDITLGPEAPQLGGLLVIATEPHASSRLDRQLAGRAARQGDPGSYQLLVSADDDLIALFDPRLAQAMRRLAGPDGEIDQDLSRHVARLQLRVARRNFEQRRQLMRHNAWLEDVLASLTGRDPAV
jgi:preprotein translocase subunit SecA